MTDVRVLGPGLNLLIPIIDSTITLHGPLPVLIPSQANMNRRDTCGQWLTHLIPRKLFYYYRQILQFQRATIIKNTKLKFY